MSGLDYYARLLRGPDGRLESFARAIGESVRPGDRVLEVGTGLGTFAFLAARAGAAQVWAVDRDPVVHLARELAAVNDPEGVVRFREGEVPGVDLPGNFDVVIFEDFPPGLLDAATHRLLRHVEEALLAPGGRLLPGAARMSLAPATLDPAWHAPVLPPVGDSICGLDLGLLRPFLANEPRRVHLSEEVLPGPAAQGEPIPLLPAPPPGRLAVTGRWKAPEGGRVDALLVWFDLETLPGEWLSNAPGPDSGPWGQLLLPVDPPLTVAAGVPVEAEAGVEPSDSGGPGWWRWSVSSGGELRQGHEFASLMVSPEQVRGLRTLPNTASNGPSSGTDP